MPEYKLIVNEDGATILDESGEVDVEIALSLIDALRERYERPACVYLLHRESSDIYKIGITAQDINSRISQIRYTEGAQDVVLVHAITCDTTTQAADLEFILHSLFEHSRVYGEWFRIRPLDIETFKELPGFVSAIDIFCHWLRTLTASDQKPSPRQRTVAYRCWNLYRPVLEEFKRRWGIE